MPQMKSVWSVDFDKWRFILDQNIMELWFLPSDGCSGFKFLPQRIAVPSVLVKDL